MNTAYERLKANLILDHVRQYLESQSFNQYKAGFQPTRDFQTVNMYSGWIVSIDAALSIVAQAQADVNKPEPVIVIVTSDVLSSLIFKVLKASIADENVTALLPFNTSLELGDNYVHIVNESLFTVSTKYHEIEQTMTLCHRAGYVHGTVSGDTARPTCPGCLAKAKGAIVNHLLLRAKGDYAKVALTLAKLQK